MKFFKSLNSKKTQKGVRHLALFCVMMIMTVFAMALGVFAAQDYVAIQASDLEPILEGAKANIGVVIPVAVGLFAIVLGIGFVPMLIKKFKH